MRPRTRQVGKGLVALAGLAAAVAGIPLGLVSLGQGPPSSVPSGHQIGDWASQPLADSAVLRAAGLACWALWALFVVSVALELSDQIGRRPTGRRWRFRVPGLQELARAGVLMTLLVLPQRPAQAEAAGLGPAAALAPLAAPAHPGSAPGVDRLARGTHPAAPAGGQQRYVVQRYDSPWSIAERHLGDGARWRELRDWDGLPLSEPASEHHNGRARPRMLQPGDVVLLPGDHAQHPLTHRTAARPVPPGGSSARAQPMVRPSPPAPAPAPAQPVTTTAPAQPGAPPASAQPTTTTTAAPPAPAQPDAGAQPTLSSPPVMANADSPPVLNQVSVPEAPARSGSRLPTPWLEAGILAASVFGLLEALRRRQRQHRPFGRRVRLPAADLASTELALRLGQGEDTATRVESALRTLLDAAERSGRPLPSIHGVVVDAYGVELVVAEPLSPPSPWIAGADDSRWRLANHDVDSELPSRSEPLPALAPIGTVTASNAEVLVNLESAGVLTVAGEPTRATGVVRAMAAALSGLPWSGALNLILVGFGTELQTVPHVRSVAAVGDVISELRSTAGVMQDLLAVHRCPDAFQARVRGLAGDGWPPTVVMCAESPADADLAELVRLAIPGGGIAAVVAATTSPGPDWVLDANANADADADANAGADVDRMALEPLGLVVDPTLLAAPELAALGQLIEIAEDRDGVTVAESPYDRLQVSVEQPEDVPATTDDTRPAVLIRVMGTVEIDGAGEFARAKSRELAVYLAMHPHGVGEAELDEALWPSDAGRVVPVSTRDSTVSVARTALGGPARLLPAQGQGREKRYQVTSQVGSDFALFCALHRRGRATRTPEPLEAALELVRGRPFEGVLSGRSYTWVHLEGHARHIESEVGDAADLAATLLLERGQPLEARWAARQGLAADPLCERLWVRLMEAADQLGESQEIERLMDELDIVLELGGDFSGLHPNTLAAYDRYRRRPRGDMT
jgi:DNA-binding SARP family transcriptional activator